jgi:NAD(P)-dependent dehydrogenase (short-subunit alcohol dehydrogenase family)
MADNDAMKGWLASDPHVVAGLANLLPVEMLESNDISNAIVWLVSDDALYVTGVALPIDAGFTIK